MSENNEEHTMSTIHDLFREVHARVTLALIEKKALDEDIKARKRMMEKSINAKIIDPYNIRKFLDYEMEWGKNYANN